MELNPALFSEFMLEAYGYPPFAWQQRLLESVLATGMWPELIAAPTGAGKSTVIDVHVFANAVAQQDGLRLPRRLVMTVNRRNLIDDHAAHADRLRELLQQAGTGTLLARVRELLQQRSDSEESLIVPVIRGGLPLRLDWRTRPLTTAVIAATPDMWGSRVLFRGYGTARNARSLEAGLLTRDCVLVIDESHLNRQLITTARRISQLDQAASESLTVPALQVVETTATPAPDADAQTMVQVTADDLRSSATLNDRLTSAKPVTLQQVNVARRQVQKLAESFCEEAIALRERFGEVSKPIGVIVNTVDLAAEISRQLRRKLPGTERDSVVTILGAQRLHDRQELSVKWPELFDVTADSDVRFIVATQTLEVGVDIDLAALVTELAPGSAIAQRSGRVNRIGARSDASVSVLQPKYDRSKTQTPYTFEELTAATEWLERRSGQPDGLAPWSLLADPPPAAETRRLLYQRPEWNDVQYWSRTSEDLAAADRTLVRTGEDLSLWLRDDFSSRVEASLIVRDHLTDDFMRNAEILRLTPPVSEEIYPISLYRLREIADKLLSGSTPEQLLLVRDDEVFQLTGGDPESDQPAWQLSARQLRAGDTLVVRPQQRIFLAGLVPHPRGDEPGRDVLDEVLSADGNIHIRRLLRSESPDGSPVSTTEQAAYQAALEYLEAANDPELNDIEPGELLLETLATALPELQQPGVEPSSLRAEVLPPVIDDGPLFVLISSAEVSAQQQFETTARKPVGLAPHQEAVAELAHRSALRLGLSEQQELLRLAGLHHDEGKREARFQLFLRGRSQNPQLLAKSGPRVSDRRRWQALGLGGWRHEQLSAAWVWADATVGNEVDRELLTWLIGTSHGRGRTTFSDGSESLLPEREGITPEVIEAAEELFDDGAWDDLFERLSRRYGPWGLAYLEALLRTADQQISAEGR